MKPPSTREPNSKDFYGLTEVHALKRAQRVLIFYGLLWVILSGLDILIHYYVPEQRSLYVVAMSFLKYLPILAVPYFTARRAAAHYLTDIFELDDEQTAEDFLSYITFGSGKAKITIDEGRIKQSDMNSPILLIGGPGFVQVNLDNAAVAEHPNGTPEVLLARSKPWVLEGFERIREIGMNGDAPQYAIIDLKDQFIKNLSIITRTKDGIPIEAHDIKIIFSVKRNEENAGNAGNTSSISEETIHSLVYKQIVQVGDVRGEEANGKFPWASTILPLALGELEDLITKSTLNEILANIGQKEIDQTNEADQKINTLKSELTGQQRAVLRTNKIPDFQPRSKITERFYTPEFKARAAELGVQLMWIDIGTWKLPSTIILEKHKEAWQLARENAAKRSGIERKKQFAKRKEFMQLIHDVVFAKFTKTRSLSWKELSNLDPENIEELRRYMTRTPEEIAKDILRAFRKELLTAQHMFASKKETFDKNKPTIEAIQSAIQNINPHIQDGK